MEKRKIYKSGYLIETNDPSLLHWENVYDRNIARGYELRISKNEFGFKISIFSNEFYKYLQRKK